MLARREKASRLAESESYVVIDVVMSFRFLVHGACAPWVIFTLAAGRCWDDRCWTMRAMLHSVQRIMLQFK